jgi:hypothetical protein
MEIKEIKRVDAIDKLIECKMTILLNDLKEFKLILKHGFFGYYEYDDYTLELLLRDRIDDSVKWEIK